jgi:CRP-like cAMP-binding protein/predicted GNAT family N-acyltransferase
MHGLGESLLTGVIEQNLLQSFCKQVRFDEGAVLRRKGHHYRDMYLITNGRVDIDRGSERGVAARLSLGPGFPVGEIGFLRGSAATATVTARTPIDALVIDDSTLARLERLQPVITARLLRRLAEIAEERTSYNLLLTASACVSRWREPIEVYLCRNREMLESAQRLRYQVHCQELGRQSPYADHDRKIISDSLDETGYTFIAVESGETIGTLRGNAARDGQLGILEELYGMRTSPHHPAATCICTKFVIKKSKRGGLAAIKLMSAAIRSGAPYSIKECYIDCVPALLPYYKAIGFTVSGPMFFHRENGPSYPMVLNLERYGKQLSDETGVRAYLNLIVKAKMIKFIDRVRRRE